MLEFNKEFLKEINACKWLKNCGNYEDLAFDFPVQIAKNKKKCSFCNTEFANKEINITFA